MTQKIVTKEGVIYQSLAGFYYVWIDGESVTTRPKGLFRHTAEKPFVGDRVLVEIDPTDAESESRLVEILPRKNQLERPAIVNVDDVLIMMSLTQPTFSYHLLDTFLVSIEARHLKPTIILSKYDLLIEELGAEAAKDYVEEIKKLYEKIGYKLYIIDGSQEAYDDLYALIDAGIFVIMGQSGVGKSTLLNHLVPSLNLKTASISDSLNRGRHTTREVTLYPVNEGFVADTPGFSALSLEQIEREELPYLYPEIAKAGQLCRFATCMHVKEPNCHVKQEVEEGQIAQSRYDHYLHTLNKIDQSKPKY